MVISIRGHSMHSNLAAGGKDEIDVGNIPQVYYSQVRSDTPKGVAVFFSARRGMVEGTPLLRAMSQVGARY